MYINRNRFVDKAEIEKLKAEKEKIDAETSKVNMEILILKGDKDKRWFYYFFTRKFLVEFIVVLTLLFLTIDRVLVPIYNIDVIKAENENMMKERLLMFKDDTLKLNIAKLKMEELKINEIERINDSLQRSLKIQLLNIQHLNQIRENLDKSIQKVATIIKLNPRFKNEELIERINELMYFQSEYKRLLKVNSITRISPSYQALDVKEYFDVKIDTITKVRFETYIDGSYKYNNAEFGIYGYILRNGRRVYQFNRTANATYNREIIELTPNYYRIYLNGDRECIEKIQFNIENGILVFKVHLIDRSLYQIRKFVD